MVDASNSSAPKLGVALATFNGGRFLGDMILSIELQDLPLDIISVSDDGSTDDTVAILASKSSRLLRFCLNSPDKRGVCGNFENAIMNCKASYIFLCDQDDVWSKSKVSIMLDSMEKAERDYGSKTPILVFSDLSVVDDGLEEIHASFYESTLKSSDACKIGDFLFGAHIPGCAMLINRSLVQAALPFPQVKYHDWWIQMVAAAVGKIVFVDMCLISYRQHGDNTVGLGKRSKLDKMFAFAHPLKIIREKISGARFRVDQCLIQLSELESRFDYLLDEETKGVIHNVRHHRFTMLLFSSRLSRSGLRLLDYLLCLTQLRSSARRRDP